MSRSFIAFGDAHVPNDNSQAIEGLKRTIAYIKPNITVSLGDMLDCSQFSAHPPTWGEEDTDFADDLGKVNGLLDFIQSHTKDRTVCVEGNHESRIARWAAKNKEGRAIYNMVCPRIRLSKGRKKFTYIPYTTVDGRYPHYKLNGRIVAVHGWSYAKHATAMHLTLSQGKSIIHGHTHRAQAEHRQSLWGKAECVGMSAGCLCRPIPTYGTGSPVSWVNGFILGYMGRNSDRMYFVAIDPDNGDVILPSGKKI